MDLSTESQKDESYLAHLGISGNDQRLVDHLLQVSRIAASLGEKIRMPLTCRLIGLLHDLGKYSEIFQRYLRSQANDPTMEMESEELERGSVDHSTAGAQLIWKRLAPREPFAAELLSMCIASHHSGLIDCIKPDGSDNLIRRMNKPDADTHSTEAWNNLNLQVKEQVNALLDAPELVEETRAAFERIRSLDRDTVIQPFKRGLLLRLIFSCLIDADRTDTADFEKPAGARLRQHGRYASWSNLIERLELKLISFPAAGAVNALRQQISMHCLDAADRPRGIYTLTVPTGGGKTLASLRFALHHARLHGLKRVIYVSPYISIVDQNAQVVREVLEPEGCAFASVVLEHHSNLTHEKESWRGNVLAENWDAPIVFTTAVQVLESLFGSGTRGVRRMHALTNAVIIFDEVQTLPARTIHLFNNAVNFLVEQCSSSVVLCTATQPLLHEVNKAKGAVRLAQNAELMPDAPQLFRELKRYETFDQTSKPGRWQIAEVASLAVQEMLDYGSCLVVVNTRRDALSLYAACKERLEDVDETSKPDYMVHLSTHMCPSHRLEKLDAMKTALKERRRVLCVSTQLIEAGVDIDFATVIRDLAGLDSIAQAAGRCNRNGERESGRVHIIKLANDLPKALEEILSAQQSASRVLDDWRSEKGGLPFDLSDPQQIRTFFDYHFFERSRLMSYPVDGEREDTLLRMLGSNSLAAADSSQAAKRKGGLLQSFKSAAAEFRVIDSLSQGVIVPFREKGKEIRDLLSSTADLDRQFLLLRRAQSYTVNLLKYEIERLSQKKALYEAQQGTGVLCLHEDFYSEEFGVDFDGNGSMEGLIA